MGSRVQWNGPVRPLACRWVSGPVMNTCGREPLARPGRPSAPPAVCARSPHRCFRGTPHVLRSSGAPHVSRHPRVTVDQGKSGGCDGEKAGGRGSTAAGIRGGTARGTPPGVPHFLVNASSAWAEPPLRLGRPRAREDMQGIIGSRESAILSRCLNCRSAMSPGVIGSRQLYGIQVCNQPPQELPEHLPGPRSRGAEAVGISRSWITSPPEPPSGRDTNVHIRVPSFSPTSRLAPGGGWSIFMERKTK
ncbi:hypothetical protein B0I12_000109 [Microbacterium hydrothermale]|nr:hypothetical protein [Microbacterium hydrothermale]